MRDTSKPAESNGAKRRYKRIAASEWEAVKESVRRLYLDENQTLEQVIENIKSDYGLDARYARYNRKRSKANDY
jgi:hypothetical protein